MISDVLSDAVHEIRDYQRTTDWMYGDWRDEIEVVLDLMGSLRACLDTAPIPSLLPSLEKVRASIRQVDLAGVREARQRLYAAAAALAASAEGASE